MKNLALTESEVSEMKQYNTLTTDEGEGPKYPYGLCLDLNDGTLEKLGITELPQVGSVVEIRAYAKVNRVSSNEEQSGSVDSCVGLQITDMEMSKKAGLSDMAKRMYPDMD